MLQSIVLSFVLIYFIVPAHCVLNDQAAFAQYADILESSNRRAAEIERMTKEAAVMENQRNAALTRAGIGNSSLAAGVGQFLPEPVGPPFGQVMPASAAQIGTDGNAVESISKGKTGPSRADDEEFLSKMQAQSQIAENSMSQSPFSPMRPMLPPFGFMPNQMYVPPPVDHLTPSLGSINMFALPPQQFLAQRIPLRAPSRVFSIEDDRTTRIAPRPGSIEEPKEERMKLPSRE